MNNLSSVDFRQLMGEVGNTLSTNRAEVLILGLGESGLAMAKWFFLCGYPLKIADTRMQPPKAADLDALVEQILQSGKSSDHVHNGSQVLWVERYFGVWHLDLLNNIKLVVISPGLSIHEKSTAELLAVCRSKKIPIWGEFEIFSRALSVLSAKDCRNYKPKILAVTGTNGKTTVCKLVNHLLEQCNVVTALAGNISPSLVERLMVALEQHKMCDDVLPEVWVIEASSFQLVHAYSFFADAAAVTNITPDHLDWHCSFEEYGKAKERIFNSLDVADTQSKTIDDLEGKTKHTLRVLCRDDNGSMTLYNQKYPCVTVGSNLPEKIGDYGVLVEKGELWLVQAVEENFHNENVIIEKSGVSTDLQSMMKMKYEKLIPANALKIRGQHNVCNALVALALARSVGLPLDKLLGALKTYEGEAHRMQLIKILHGVSFIDDSKATNVGATVAALRSLNFFEQIDQNGEKLFSHRKCLLIAGGDGKGQDFRALTGPILEVCRGVFLIGRDAQKISSVLDHSKIKVDFFSSLNEAVKAAIAFANIGDIVLLSPACASWDMFRNYEHRAAVFHEAIIKHAH